MTVVWFGNNLRHIKVAFSILLFRALLRGLWCGECRQFKFQILRLVAKAFLSKNWATVPGKPFVLAPLEGDCLHRFQLPAYRYFEPVR